MLCDRGKQGSAITEHAILKQAFIKQLPHIAHLTGVYIGVTHIAFTLPEYEIDLRTYLEVHRDHKQLPKLLDQVIAGIEQLHELGYVHRDIKPDNIVLSLRPLRVSLIDFDIAQMRASTPSGMIKGTPGYYPMRPNLKDGSTLWDVWGMAAVILECDMRPGEYLGTANERGAQLKAEEHCKAKDTSPSLRIMLTHTMLRNELGTMEGLGFMRKMLRNVAFHKYQVFKPALE